VKFLLTAAGLLALSAGSMFADPLTLDGPWLEFQFGGVGSFAFGCGGTCSLTTNPVAIQSTTAPFTFTGPGLVEVVDLFLAGDTFTVFDNGVGVGNTSAVALSGSNACIVFGPPVAGDIGCSLGNPLYSKGFFNLLGPGSHSITIQATQVLDPNNQTNRAAAIALRDPIVPEPATMVLMGGGLVLLGFKFRRKA